MMSQQKTLSAAMIEREKVSLRREIDTLRTIPPAPGALLRAEITGRLRVLHSLGLINDVEEQAFTQLADVAQEQGETA
jgi:hypothetical protein